MMNITSVKIAPWKSPHEGGLADLGFGGWASPLDAPERWGVIRPEDALAVLEGLRRAADQLAEAVARYHLKGNGVAGLIVPPGPGASIGEQADFARDIGNLEGALAEERGGGFGTKAEPMTREVFVGIFYQDITQNSKVACLSSPWAKLLYTWLLPFLDNAGRMLGDPDLVKAMVFPREKEIAPWQVEEWLAELAAAGLIFWYFVGDAWYIQFPDWSISRGQGRRYQQSKYPPPPGAPEGEEKED